MYHLALGLDQEAQDQELDSFQVTEALLPPDLYSSTTNKSVCLESLQLDRKRLDWKEKLVVVKKRLTPSPTDDCCGLTRLHNINIFQ